MVQGLEVCVDFLSKCRGICTFEKGNVFVLHIQSERPPGLQGKDMFGGKMGPSSRYASSRSGARMDSTFWKNAGFMLALRPWLSYCSFVDLGFPSSAACGRQEPGFLFCVRARSFVAAPSMVCPGVFGDGTGGHTLYYSAQRALTQQRFFSRRTATGTERVQDKIVTSLIFPSFFA
jgi:hypothetical protein